MTSKRRAPAVSTTKAQCPTSGKRCYPTRKEAAFVAAKVRREGEPVQWYKCLDCNEYHIGHPTTRQGWAAVERRTGR